MMLKPGLLWLSTAGLRVRQCLLALSRKHLAAPGSSGLLPMGRASGLQQGAGRAQQRDLAVGGVAVLLVHCPQGCAGRPAVAPRFSAARLAIENSSKQGHLCLYMLLLHCQSKSHCGALIYIEHTAEDMQGRIARQSGSVSAAQGMHWVSREAHALAGERQGPDLECRWASSWAQGRSWSRV